MEWIFWLERAQDQGGKHIGSRPGLSLSVILPGTPPVLASKDPFPGKPLTPGQIGTIGHPYYILEFWPWLKGSGVGKHPMWGPSTCVYLLWGPEWVESAYVLLCDLACGAGVPGNRTSQGWFSHFYMSPRLYHCTWLSSLSSRSLPLSLATAVSEFGPFW